MADGDVITDVGKEFRFKQRVEVEALIDFDAVANQLAGQCSTVQAIFFQCFLDQLAKVCPSQHEADMQLCYLRDDLTDEAREKFRLMTGDP